MLLHREKSDIFPSVQKQVQSFFNNSVTTVAKLKTNRGVGFLPSIEGVEESVIEGKKVETNFLEKFFTKYNNQKFAKVYPKIDGTLENNSKIFQIDHLTFSEAGFMASTILRNFKGRHLILEGAELMINDVTEFLRRWVSNVAYHKLEHATIVLRKNVLVRQQIMNRFRTMPWDQNRRPQMYHSCPRMVSWTGSSYFSSIDCKDSLDLERENDRKLSSISIEYELLRFCVWNDKQLEIRDTA